MTFEFEELFYTFFSRYYKHHIEAISRTKETKSLNINWREIEKFDTALADAVIENPEMALAGATKALEKFKDIHGTPMKLHPRIYNLPKVLSIEEVSSRYLKNLIAFKGLVSRRGEALHKAKINFYKCNNCEEKIKIPAEEDDEKTKKCRICNKGKLKLMVEESTFIDFQRIEVQDLLERVRPGTQAAKVYCFVEDDLVNYVVPGDTVEITGILKINPKGKDNIFSRYVEVVHINKIKKEFEELEITEEDKQKIHEFAKKENVAEEIIKAIAPDIHGYDDIKLALALQLFGGTKDKIGPGGMELRDNIHILLIGDPGLAKTKLLQETCSIAPKSIYVSGKGVSGAGLTATAEKDELSGGGWTLKAGALVLASGGIAAIDEFDKISDEDRASLHEVMESGKVSMAKAGIVATFKAKTSILAAANPKLGRFIESKNISDQFNIPPSLLSRFDLIFPIRDVVDEEKDKKLAKHIITIHKSSSKEIQEEIKERKTFIRKYIGYARIYVHPKLTDEAAEEIENFYTELRKLGQKTGTVTITPRYLEGLIRLAEAHAKMRLSNKVEAKDAEVAIMLMKKMIYDIMVDKETGVLDVDVISTGISARERDLTTLVLNVVEKLEKEYEAAEIEMVINEIKMLKPEISEEKIRKTIEKALKEGFLYEPSHGNVKVVKNE